MVEDLAIRIQLQDRNFFRSSGGLFGNRLCFNGGILYIWIGQNFVSFGSNRRSPTGQARQEQTNDQNK
jgi:hypothetical protein